MKRTVIMKLTFETHLLETFKNLSTSSFWSTANYSSDGSEIETSGRKYKRWLYKYNVFTLERKK